MSYSKPNRFVPVSAKFPCPICHKTDNCNFVSDTGDVYCRRVESEIKGKDGGWFHRHNNNAPLPQPHVRVTSEEHQNQPALPNILDRVYRRLLSVCPLIDSDHAHLTKRGLSDEEISRHGYGSFGNPSAADRKRLAQFMVTGEFGDVASRIPGIYRENGDLTITGRPGILIPVIQNGMIIGVRIRRTDKSAGSRYSWFSSKAKSGGYGGAPAHVATPKHCKDTSTVIITEGEIKANITADRLGRPVISVPGVTIIGEVLPLLEKLGATTVWMAYDSDTASNPRVAEAERRLIAKLLEGGLEVRRLSWPSVHKGIDDALTAGCTPVADAMSADDNGTENASLKRQASEERAFTAAVFRAIGSKQNGPEASTAVTIIHDLRNRRVPAGHWVPMTRERMSQICGISTKTATIHKNKIMEHYPEALEFETRHISKSVNKSTGELKPPHDLVFVRLNVDPLMALNIIADYTPATAKNGNGGWRQKRPICPTCGPETGVKIESRFRCAHCDNVIKVIPPKIWHKSTAPEGRSVPRQQDDPQRGFPLTNTLSTGDRVSPGENEHPGLLPTQSGWNRLSDRYTDVTVGGRP